MPWVDNCFVAPDRSIFTVTPEGNLEIRGPGWERNRRKGEPPGVDKPRICKLGSPARAMRIAKQVIKLAYNL